MARHQHSHHQDIISALHVHLDAHNCLEIIVVRGKAKEVRKMADELIGTKGVKHGKLMDDHVSENPRLRKTNP